MSIIMQGMKLVFVSSNEGKIKEAERILGVGIDIARIHLDEIQSLDLEVIVKKKAEQAFKLIKKPLIVDDVGLFLDAWNGLPGPFIKFIEEIMGYKKLLNILENEKNRRTVIRSVIGFHDGNKIHIFTGEVKGEFQREAKGDSGWGFDPYFLPDGHSETFAQMGQVNKSKISHRGLALKKLRTHLKL